MDNVGSKNTDHQIFEEKEAMLKRETLLQGSRRYLIHPLTQILSLQ